LCQAVFESVGYRCEVLPIADLEAFQLGKENCNNAECNPSYFTIGALLKFLRQKEAEGFSRQDITRKYVLFTVGSCGPCRHGIYEAEYRFALQNAGFGEFRVLLFQQSKGIDQSGEPGLQYSADLGMGMLNALFLGDVTSDLVYQIRPYEVNPGETDRVLGESLEYLADFLRDREPFEILETLPSPLAGRLARKKSLKNLFNNLGKFREHFWGKAYVEALTDCRDRINQIEVDRLQVKPLVKVTGEFFAQTAEGLGNYDMFRFLEREGAQVQIEAVGCWITYLLFQARNRWSSRRGLDGPYEKTQWWELKKRLANHLHFTKRHSLLAFAERTYGHLHRRAADGLGGKLAHRLLSQNEIASLAHPFYNTLARGGEGHMEIGKNIHYAINRLSHMVLSLKPFGCMPSTLSDGVQSAVVNRYPEMLFLPVETTGDGEVHAHSRVQMTLSDAKTKARTEFQEALESTGKELNQIRDYVSAHRELRRPLYPVPHRPGTAGVAANFVMHVSDVMDGRARLARA
jgi:predicted nucleotide-binding protein (sugar kinase/HSP70/actin superfamily)